MKSSSPPPSQYDSVAPVPTPRTPTWRSAPDPLPRLLPPVHPVAVRGFSAPRSLRKLRAAILLSGLLTLMFVPAYVTAYTLVHLVLKYL